MKYDIYHGNTPISGNVFYEINVNKVWITFSKNGYWSIDKIKN